ncbi:MAG TPA: phosphoserine transaminase [Gammaproteobacteria bacterium]|nr:phosphoserine transaminase [Gammaproteobacteria bacterium]
MNRPPYKPASPYFSSGPCKKHPNWSLNSLKDSCIQRSHRSDDARKKLRLIIDESKALLNIPDNYEMIITPGSDTGAFELALWNMLGVKSVDVFIWDYFSKEWANSLSQLPKLKVNPYRADYGYLPNLEQANKDHDIIFCWNGTTSGVKVPHCDWVSNHRSGLTFCDATSAIFAYELDWQKLDVTTFSWQKSLGSESQHGMLILSPKAIQRLLTYTPEWPIPKIFRLVKNNQFIEGLFQGNTINTPSLLATEDYLSALNWAKSIGGIKTLNQRTQNNLDVVISWVNNTDWIELLATERPITSSTSICLKIIDPDFTQLALTQQQATLANFLKLLHCNHVAYDINSHRDTPNGLRIWGGPTIETSCLEALFPWLEWAYHQTTIKRSF